MCDFMYEKEENKMQAKAKAKDINKFNQKEESEKLLTAIR